MESIGELTVHVVRTASLGDRSYLLTDGSAGADALVVDPQRDIDRMLTLATDLGVRIAVVAETHVHNDYVSGGPELASTTGASYLLPVGSDAELSHTVVAEGDVVPVGNLRVTVLHTPGHTHHHIAFAVSVGDGPIEAVLTGGSMLFGSAGRTDLVAAEDTETLTHAQYHSVRRLAQDLPDDAQVLPTHGFGSFCSATPTSGDASTIGEQRTANPALTQDEATYVEGLISGLDAYPAYYVHMAPTNRRGAPPVDLTPPAPVTPQHLRENITAGEWVVDLRSRTAFAAGHLAGSRSHELGTSFVTYLGWLLPWGAPLTLIGETAEQVTDARRELARIGVDRLGGAAVGPIEALADGRALRSYAVSDFAGLAARLADRSADVVHVLDARSHSERREGYVPGSQHIPVHELAARLDEVPCGEVWVYCGSGYRASIASSMLDTTGRIIVHVDEDYPATAPAGRLVRHDLA